MKIIKTVVGLFFPVVLAACSSSSVENEIIPESQFTVLEVYEGKTRQGQERQVNSVVKRPPNDYEVGFDPYLNNGAQKVRYRKLPNPTLYLYFFPGVSSTERMPTPGWMTEIPMYERDEYAKPGESYVGSDGKWNQ